VVSGVGFFARNLINEIAWQRINNENSPGKKSCAAASSAHSAYADTEAALPDGDAVVAAGRGQRG
jgi:hypothetical protein